MLSMNINYVVDLIYYSVNLSPYLEILIALLRISVKATPITLWCVSTLMV